MTAATRPTAAKKASTPGQSPPRPGGRAALRALASARYKGPDLEAIFERLTERLTGAVAAEVVARLRVGEDALEGAQPARPGRTRFERNVDPDPLAEARERGVRRRDESLRAEGGTLSAEEVARQLAISRQAVNERRAKNKLLAVRLGKDYLYPAWQFTSEGTLPGLEAVLEALSDAPPWAKFRFFLSGSYRLAPDGRARPLDLLRKGELEPVLRDARTFGEHGAA
jgi:hypothetical protein